MVVADTVVSLGVLAAFYALLALGMNVKYGHTGLLDFGHVGFYLIGAYSAALFVLPPESGGPDTVYLFGLNLPVLFAELLPFLPFAELLGWIVAVLCATVLAGVVGVFVALPTLRLREDYLAITVLGMAVILQRIVQAESWLVNGPDALRGIPRPLPEFFPLTGATLSGAVGFFLISAAIWAATVFVLGHLLESDDGATYADGAGGDGPPPGARSTLAGRLHTVASLGTGRFLSDRRAAEDAASGVGSAGRSNRGRSALAAGAIVGAVGGVLTLITPLALLIWGTLLSALTWIVLLVGLARFAEGFDAIDYAVTLALGLGYMLALAPVYFLESPTLWVPLTLLAFAVVIGATLYLHRNWSRFAERPFRYGIFTGLWFGAVWYFPLQILSSVQAGQFVVAATTVFNNAVWVLSFSGAEPVIGYSRFQLFLFGTVLFVSLYAMELIVESPFGRVLRAVRDDERVVNSLGKDPFMYKLQSMALGSALAGLAGVLAAIYFQTLVFTMFAPRVTFIALLMMFLGGVGNNRAMIVGAFLFWAFQSATTQLAGFVAPEFRTRIQALRFVVMGILFLALLYYRPEGLLGERSRTGAGGE
ncbi:branched-chain amino acid ABC transporter permease [Halobacteriales archaeon QS_5_70_15]|nr:MAG: branched-chain amino acid ABC transporter permease [Halobacteriales archaeon QS_5_70_15]